MPQSGLPTAFAVSTKAMRMYVRIGAVVTQRAATCSDSFDYEGSARPGAYIV